jgi:hypothetical protein
VEGLSTRILSFINMTVSLGGAGNTGAGLETAEALDLFRKLQQGLNRDRANCMDVVRKYA